ncbi:carbohydrate kinase family protein [Legionella cincinnatiensis]|uniref:Carbohydrate kinase, pfkB family n=1 Tax=Legionella cincinnatiensis TaxID=28085 RepID=A0A378IGM9_9GAMM|nr:carbohydrate kinase family protein [Legionella cincinnatiensis]KTC86254.1 carbohydrate kinase, pfkB family [Legionella cincinnatiensis]STX33865.1 carbohydrate kinase, pfkB family [Legionella cincinnatiensis]
MTKIICLGGVTVDRKIIPTHQLQLGTSNPVSSLSTFGGVAHNVAKNLALLTNDIHFCSVVGEDQEGIDVQTHLKNLGIAIKNILTIPQQKTAHYDVLLDHEGELYIALADMEIFDHIPLQKFTRSWEEWEQGDIVFLDTNLPKPIIEHALNRGRTQNIKLCIDPVSVVKAKKLSSCLEHVFLLKPDRFEAEALTNISIHSISDCIKAGKILLNKGVENCIISLGKFGYVLVNEKIQKHFPTFFIESVVDVSGAGDAFLAGVLYELKQGTPVAQACQTGAAMAVLTIQSPLTVNEQINLEMLREIQFTYRLRETDHAAIF